MESITKRKHSKAYSLANLNYLYNQKKLWLNPSYQRESVWALSQKQLLMDSLLNDIDIPKLYFREVNNDYDFEVVDGQQRLRTIFEFFQDQFKLSIDSDKIDNEEVASKNFSNLSVDLQMKLRDSQVDVVELVNYSDDDIEEMFLRLQNGTPLNAAEKRRAISGNMRKIVEKLSRHKVFTLCAFSGNRYAYEDAVAKIMHEIMSPVMTDIKHSSIKKTYETNKNIDEGSNYFKSTNSSLNFLYNSLKGRNPGLKKFSIITLGHLVSEMLDTYDLTSHSKEFADCYIDFELRRRKNEEVLESKQDSRLAAYTDAARADSIQDLQYRHDLLLEEFVRTIPTLKLKDSNRSFTDEQRRAIYWKDNGTCQICKKKCKETEFHADHIKPHSKGNPTSIANGQVLCPICNLKKGNREY